MCKEEVVLLVISPSLSLCETSDKVGRLEGWGGVQGRQAARRTTGGERQAGNQEHIRRAIFRAFYSAEDNIPGFRIVSERAEGRRAIETLCL